MTKDRRVCLAHILECIQKIERFTADGKFRFHRDDMVQDAVIRNLEIIGEVAKRIDEDCRAAHPDIPWLALTGPRDVLISVRGHQPRARMDHRGERPATPEAGYHRTAPSSRPARARARGGG